MSFAVMGLEKEKRPVTMGIPKLGMDVATTAALSFAETGYSMKVRNANRIIQTTRAFAVQIVLIWFAVMEYEMPRKLVTTVTQMTMINVERIARYPAAAIKS